MSSIMYPPDDYYYINYSQEELDKTFILYCSYGNLERVKHMLSGKEMKNHPNIHAEDDEAFWWLIKKPYPEIVEYLIFEKKIKMTPQMEKILDDIGDDYSKMVKNQLIISAVNESLNKDLPVNNSKAKKAKV